MDRPAQAIRDALARGAEVSDLAVDQLFPDELRDRSHLHWTPVEVAVRAAALLTPRPRLRILDIGSGVGKVCLVGAAVTDATWWGIEQDAVQIAAAHRAAWMLDLERTTRFVQGDGSRLSWAEFDGFYLYNPFSTLMLAPHASPFVRYATVQSTLRRITQRLAAAPAGTRVVTYHGFGGPMPAGYTRHVHEPFGGDALELWVRDGELRT